MLEEDQIPTVHRAHESDSRWRQPGSVVNTFEDPFLVVIPLHSCSFLCDLCIHRMERIVLRIQYRMTVHIYCAVQFQI
jgi:hypothetical protein